MGEWLAWVAGIVAAVGGIIVGMRAAGRAVRRANHFFDDWFGEPPRPGQPARPGVMERLATLEGRVEGIEGQLKPNGGSTVYDKVTKIAKAVDQQ